MDSIKSTAIVMFIMNAAGLLSWIITVNRVPQTITAMFLAISNNPYVLLLLINILLLVVGVFMNASPAVIILAPILVPIVESLGIDKVLFGVIMIVNLAIGTITPPVGSTFSWRKASRHPVIRAGQKRISLYGDADLCIAIDHLHSPIVALPAGAVEIVRVLF